MGSTHSKGRSGIDGTGRMVFRMEGAGAKARRILKEELQRRGWRERDLVARRKSDPANLALAARLRRETTLSRKAIAALAHLGSSKSANTRLHEWMRRDNEANAKKRKV